MKNKDKVVLRKILKYCDEINLACKMFENEYKEFCSNSVFANACSMCILQIGELCKNISMELRNEEVEIDWRGWCGIRDVFAHQYSNIHYDEVWDVIQNDIPQLRFRIESILDEDGEK